MVQSNTGWTLISLYVTQHANTKEIRMPRKLRAVLVGCGGIAGAWISPAKEMAGLSIDGFVDLDLAKAKERKEVYGNGKAETGTDLRAMLKATNPDIVFDCTVPSAHASVTLEALRYGCHVLGEKPLAESMENAKKMVRAAKKAEKLYAVIQNRRYDPDIIAYRKFLTSGKVGDLTTLNCDFYIGAHFGGFRQKMKHVLLLDMAIHTFDAIRFISGEDARTAYCVEWNPKGSWYKHGASAQVIFEMTNGVVASYRGSWCSEGLNTSWESDWRAIGTKGSAAWTTSGLAAQSVKVRKGLRNESIDHEIVSKPIKDRGHHGVMRDFLRCVRNGKEPQTVCTDNIKSLAMVFAAVESAETGKKVRVR
jgi:predicted dehydrogenase